ncbi:MAG: YgiQ family radical SAM protein [Planctomycetaceae bacterium]|nr:YgiQ family radical SAM protein [Planctomycetaceae bacterium]
MISPLPILSDPVPAAASPCSGGQTGAMLEALGGRKLYRRADKPLPMSAEEARARGWDEVDIVFVTGDAYIDHPSFAMALLGRVLEAAGFRVGVISQPDWRNAEAWKRFGRPRLFFAISAGNMDSMINHYTANRKVRNSDAYSPGGRIGLRPDRATLAYCQRAREAYRGVPVIAGGVEASLRRLAHYDYWSDTVKRSILLDSKADLVGFGMGEESIVEIARRLKDGATVKDLRDLRGIAYAMGASEQPPADALEIPAYEEVVKDKVAFAEATKRIHNETNPYNAKRLIQRHDRQWVVCNAPCLPISQGSMDAIHALPFTRRPHPSYNEPIPAFEMIKDSVSIMRGCFGGCTFCSITTHQGRIIQSRSPESVLAEVKGMTTDPQFKGVISDIGGPTANMYQMKCSRPEVEAKCRRQSCVHPTICKLLGTDHGPLVQLMKDSRETKGVRKVLVASGIRMDLARRSPEYMRDLVQHHVGGHLKVAPEHTDPGVLNLMRKPSGDDFTQFAGVFERESEKAGKTQYIIPYFIASHPGSDLNAMIDLAVFLKRNGYKPDQVQDFIPAPFDVATAMYHTGLDPFTKKPVHIAKHLRDRKLQRALLQFFKPENYFEVRKALEQAKRQDLIGFGCDALIPPHPPREALDRRRQQANAAVRDDGDEDRPASGDIHVVPRVGKPSQQASRPGSHPPKSKGSRKQSRFKPGQGYRPERRSTKKGDADR